MKNFYRGTLFTILVLTLPLTAHLAAAQSSSSPLPNQSTQTITLKDGTVLKGQLSGVSGGTYTIQTPTMGAIHVRASEIRTITAGDGATSAPQLPAPSTASASTMNPSAGMPNLNTLAGGKMQQLQSISQGLLSDPEISAAVNDIANDPELVRLIQNPSLFNQVMTGNPQQTQSDPTVQQLLKNPKVQNLMNKIMTKMSSNPGALQGLMPASSGGSSPASAEHFPPQP